MSMHIREPEEAASHLSQFVPGAPYRSAFRNRFGQRISRSSMTDLEYRGKSITTRPDYAGE